MSYAFNAVCSLALLCTITVAQEATPDRRSREYLESLDDVTLLLHEDAKGALNVYKERSRNYTKEQSAAVMQAYLTARAEQLSSDNATTEVLLERMSTSIDTQQRQYASMALLRKYEKADDAERLAIRLAFVTAWQALPAPQVGERPGDAHTLFFTFLHRLDNFFSDEAEVLPVLEERCVDSGLDEGLFQMFNTLLRGQFALGPLTAARAEAVYNAEFQPGTLSSMDGESYYVLRSILLSVMGKCGESGIAALRRLEVLSTPEGFSALKTMELVDAEPLLWEMVEDPDTQPLTKLEAMYMIQFKAYNAHDSARSLRFREPLSALLTMPRSNESYQLEILERAVDLAMRLKDTYYHPRLTTLEASIDWKALAELERNAQGGLDPDKFPLQYSVGSLKSTIESAKAHLSE